MSCPEKKKIVLKATPKRLTGPSKTSGTAKAIEQLSSNSTCTTPAAPLNQASSPDVADAKPAKQQEPPKPSLLKEVLGDKLPTSRHAHPPTDEQSVIIKAAKAGPKVLIVEAGAGCGKTSLLQMLEQELPGRGQYTAFNSSLVADSKTKFKRASVNTTHALAMREVGKQFRHRLSGPRVKSEQIARLLNLQDIRLEVPDLTGDGAMKEKRLAAGFLAGQVMSAVRRFANSDRPEITEDFFPTIPGIDLPREDGSSFGVNNAAVRELLLPIAKIAWQDLNDPQGKLPYAHDFYLKSWQLSNPIISADYVMIDEAQDLTPVTISILKNQKHAQLIVVGDSQQEIYAWRGCRNAMAEWPDAPRLWLSQSFRFGQAVADVANAVLDSLEKPTKLRLRGLPSIPSRVDHVTDPRCVLTRTNAAAVSTVLQAIGEGKRPHLIGGGSEVLAFVQGCQDLQAGKKTMHPELSCFDSWQELQEYVKLEEGKDLELLVKLVKEFTAQRIISALQHMPEEKESDLVVCTAHKSKGREWESVKLAGDFPIHKPNEDDGEDGNRSAPASDADRRLIYVAATRAQHVLDVTECPFFSGPGSLPVQFTNDPIWIDWSEWAGKKDAVQPEKVPLEPEPKDFTWAKFGRDDSWHIRGRRGMTGQVVEVVRKDGSRASVKVGKVVWEDQVVAIYKPEG